MADDARMVAFYDFEEGSGEVLHDQSAGENNPGEIGI
jgi:hypothetical protein